MAVMIVSDPAKEYAALVCTVTDWAFGPAFLGRDADLKAENFLLWMEAVGAGDPCR